MWTKHQNSLDLGYDMLSSLLEKYQDNTITVPIRNKQDVIIGAKSKLMFSIQVSNEEFQALKYLHWVSEELIDNGFILATVENGITFYTKLTFSNRYKKVYVGHYVSEIFSAIEYEEEENIPLTKDEVMAHTVDYLNSCFQHTTTEGS